MSPVFATTDGRCILFDLATQEKREILEARVASLRLSADGSRLLAHIEEAGVVHILQLPEGTQIYNLKLDHNANISGDGRVVVGVSRNGSVHRITLETGVVETWSPTAP